MSHIKAAILKLLNAVVDRYFEKSSTPVFQGSAWHRSKYNLAISVALKRAI